MDDLLCLFFNERECGECSVWHAKPRYAHVCVPALILSSTNFWCYLHTCSKYARQNQGTLILQDDLNKRFAGAHNTGIDTNHIPPDNSCYSKSKNKSKAHFLRL